MKKYELTTETKTLKMDDVDFDVYQIKALRDIPNENVYAGDLGGYVLSEDCLSHSGDCWIYPDSIATHRVVISENAVVSGDSLLRNNVKVSGDSVIEDAHIAHNVIIGGKTRIERSSVRFDCTFVGDVEIEDSKVCSMDMSEGEIIKSSIMVKNRSVMKVKGKATFVDTKIEIRGDYQSFIKRGGSFKGITAKRLKRFDMYDYVELVNIEFAGETKLKFGDEQSADTDQSKIGGTKNFLCFEELEILAKKLDITDDVFLKGYMVLNNCRFSGTTEVVNETKHPLILNGVELAELAKINKLDQAPHTLAYTQLNMDTEYTC